MKPKQWTAFLELLASTRGFKVTPNYRIVQSSAEIYKWNRFTVQVSAEGFDSVERILIHVFFDSEQLDWRNKVIPMSSRVEDLPSVLCVIDREIGYADSNPLVEIFATA